MSMWRFRLLCDINTEIDTPKKSEGQDPTKYAGSA